MHLVNCAVTIAPWTLPGPIGAYLACGGDWRAAVLNIILIVISVVLYYPFFKMYDKELLEEGIYRTFLECREKSISWKL